MKKKFSKFLGVGLALVLACSFALVPAAPVSATITADPIIAPVTTAIDDVAGKENAAYQITYTQDTTFDVKVITVTFPAEYAITDGDLGTAAVKNGDGSESGFVTIEAENRAIDNVIGDDVNRTIVITLINSYNYAGGETVSFRIVSGITNPILIGAYAGLTVDDDADGNIAVEAAAVTIIAGAAAQVRVETAADGNGTVVPAQDVVSGDTLTVYAITRDANNNFVANVAADWSLEEISGDVVPGDLAPATGTSTIFTGALVGTAKIMATEGGLFRVPSETLTVILGAATQVVMTPETDISHVAGTDIIFTAELQDAAGNHIDFTAVGDVTFSGGDGNWGVANTLEVDKTITCVYTTSTAVVTDEVLTVTENIEPPADAQIDTATITTLAGTATQVLVEDANDGTGDVVVAQDVVSGNSIIVYAITRDTNDNFVENVAADWSLVNKTGGVVDGDLLGEGTSATFTGALVGTAVIHATSGELIPGDSGIITVTEGAETRLAFVDQPSDTVAGQAITPAVTVEIIDAGGNRITTAMDTITIDIGFNAGGGTLDGTLMVAADAGLATFDDLWIDKTGVGYTLVATSGILTEDTSDAFNITPAEKMALAFVLQPTNTGAGETISVTVEILDEFDNRTLDTDNIAIDILNNPSGGTLSGITTVAAEAGLATFSLSIDKMGTGYTLRATSGVLGQANSGAFNITVGTAASLAFVEQPTDAVAGVTITPAVTVKIVDIYGNQTADTDTITIAILANPGDGTLSGTLEVAAEAGLATFDSLSIDKTGVDYTLVATSGVLDQAISDVFDITPAAKAALAFVQQPTDTIAGETISPDVTVEIVDEFGNRVPTAIESITIAILNNPSVDQLGALSGTVTAVDAVEGLATFSDLSIDKVGSGYTLAVTSSGALTSDTSDAFDITPAAVFDIDVAAEPTSIAVGLTSTITATVTDAYGNNVADGTPVSFNTTLGLVSSVTALTANGEATTTLNAGLLSGTATVTATADGVSGNTTVVFTPLVVVDAITVIAEPASIPANGFSTSTITVTLVDEHGNTVPTAGATVHLETTAGGLNPVSGATEAGVFTSELKSSDSPITATVTANVVGIYSDSVTVDFYSPLEPNQIRLQEGWNAISLPLIPNNPSIGVVLAGVLDKVEVVWAYDPTLSLLERWSSYIPDPEAPIGLTEMEDGVGYWVEMSEGAVLTITGVVQPLPPQTPREYSVVEGWNLIGFKSLNPMPYDDYLVNLVAGDYSVIWGYSDNLFYNVLHRPILIPGSGYWIWMTASGIIVPPGE